MSRSVVLLVNPNRMRPPIGPVGLDYVAEALRRTGHEPVLCDLAFADDWASVLDAAIAETAPSAIGLSARNIDDAYFASQDFTLETTAAVARHILNATQAPLILGGVGFSCAPREILRFTGASFGIVGDGEGALPQLVDHLAWGEDPSTIPGVVFRGAKDRIVLGPPALCALESMPAPPRRFADNARYFAEGGQAGVETKRGCSHHCIYCVDPVAKGHAPRLRTAQSVAQEFADLLDQGIDAVHLCDSEFNLPPEHARAVCEELARKGIGAKVRWHTYACPRPFDRDLAKAMARAGCAGVNFGVDHVDEALLHRLGRGHRLDDLRRTVHACRDAGLAAMFDMLLGGPGETRETIERALEAMSELKPDRVGLSCGVRVYPHTPLARLLHSQGPLSSNPNLHGAVEGNDDLLRPIFYVDSAVGPDIQRFVWSRVGGDKRFFIANPDEAGRNYNYNDNSVLARAIANGARGAYWDILRRMESLSD